jgi:hypothetical protein
MHESRTAVPEAAYAHKIARELHPSLVVLLTVLFEQRPLRPAATSCSAADNFWEPAHVPPAFLEELSLPH